MLQSFSINKHKQLKIKLDRKLQEQVAHFS